MFILLFIILIFKLNPSFYKLFFKLLVKVFLKDIERSLKMKIYWFDEHIVHKHTHARARVQHSYTHNTMKRKILL